ncbi:unnamed protein product [Paramecium pentaurelia]|uniref:Uncharacterized protein n=1 Tax=Paramecium pentaurelia TaxID=43138 RepID=A0A8S1S3D0_9CILI|nr:unnamed protein product [Paramecium pentaurelia]
MSARYHKQDQKFDKEFLAIVDAFGGKNCTSWTQVARKFELQTGEKVQKANTLRYRWEQLTGYSENFTKEQQIQLIESDIKSRGVKRQGLNDFYQLTGIKLYKGRFCRISSQHIKQAIQSIDEVFAKERKHRRCGKKDAEFRLKLSHLSIYILLRAKDTLTSEGFKQKNKGLDPFEQYLCQQLIEASDICERLYLMHARVFQADRVDRYQSYMKVINRNQYRKLMFYIEYLDILRKISVEQCTNDTIVSHPLVLRNIKKNKETLVYKNLILENDWSQKYQWFNECTLTQIQEEEFSLLLKSSNRKSKQKSSQCSVDPSEVDDQRQNKRIELNNLQFDFIPKHCQKVYAKINSGKANNKTEKEYRKFRGHFIKPGDTRTDTRYTKIFTCDDDSEYDADQNEQEAQIQASSRQEKLQILYNEAFISVPNKKKQNQNIQDITQNNS